MRRLIIFAYFLAWVIVALRVGDWMALWLMLICFAVLYTMAEELE